MEIGQHNHVITSCHFKKRIQSLGGVCCSWATNFSHWVSSSFMTYHSSLLFQYSGNSTNIILFFILKLENCKFLSNYYRTKLCLTFYRYVLGVDLYVKSVVKAILYSPFSWILLPCVPHVVLVIMLVVSVLFAVLGVSDEKQGTCQRKPLERLEKV